MRVVHVGPGGATGRGGIGRYIAYVLSAAEVDNSGISCSAIDSYGHRGRAAMTLAFLGACVQVLTACLFRRVDILHIHMSHYGSALRKCVLLLLGKACGAKVVLHIHGSQFDIFCDDLPRWQRRLVVGCLGKADRVVVIARVWESYVLGLGIARDKVRLVHNGVPDSGRRDDGAVHRDGPVRLLALGELGPRKGTPEILAALSDDRLRSLSWRAVIAGNGDVAAYRQAFAAAGLDSRVELPGWVDGVSGLLSQADILMLPSRQEGLPLAILEALATGIPVISTPVGGIPDAVVDGVSGLLVPPGDAPALASALARLIGDAGLRARLGAAGRRLFESEFDMRNTFFQLKTIYQELCPASAALAAGSVSRGKRRE